MSRTAEIKQERRRRQSDGLSGSRKRLHVDEKALDRENFVYRFVNDDGDRIHRLTKLDDWDIAPEASGGKSEETATGTSIRAGTKANGDALRTVLVRKRKEFAEADEAAKQRKIDEQEQGLKTPSDPNQYAGDDMSVNR